MNLPFPLPSRWTLITTGLCAVAIPLSIWLSFDLGRAKFERDQAAKARDGLHSEIYTPTTGYRDRLTTCTNSRLALQGELDTQNEAVKNLKSQGDAAAARAAAAIAAARAEARAANAAAEKWRQFQPAEGETICEAAFRLHQESTR